MAHTSGMVEWTVEVSSSHQACASCVANLRRSRPYRFRAKHLAVHSPYVDPKINFLLVKARRCDPRLEVVSRKARQVVYGDQAYDDVD